MVKRSIEKHKQNQKGLGPLKYFRQSITGKLSFIYIIYDFIAIITINNYDSSRAFYWHTGNQKALYSLSLSLSLSPLSLSVSLFQSLSLSVSLSLSLSLSVSLSLCLSLSHTPFVYYLHDRRPFSSVFEHSLRKLIFPLQESNKRTHFTIFITRFVSTDSSIKHDITLSIRTIGDVTNIFGNICNTGHSYSGTSKIYIDTDSECSIITAVIIIAVFTTYHMGHLFNDPCHIYSHSKHNVSINSVFIATIYNNRHLQNDLLHVTIKSYFIL